MFRLNKHFLHIFSKLHLIPLELLISKGIESGLMTYFCITYLIEEHGISEVKIIIEHHYKDQDFKSK